ncbi:MAG: hypothetical protein PHU80_01150 [Kiritimatiellae bacterium]|nr:hypothetical protein [Kiritimatiellia bacterium]
MGVTGTLEDWRLALGVWRTDDGVVRDGATLVVAGTARPECENADGAGVRGLEGVVRVTGAGVGRVRVTGAGVGRVRVTAGVVAGRAAAGGADGAVREKEGAGAARTAGALGD